MNSRTLFLLAIVLPGIVSFNVHMEYKPPVKSSVRKLYDRRNSVVSTRRTSRTKSPDPRRSSSSSKSAYAGVYHPQQQPSENGVSTGVATFERRMRELVLGTQKSSQATQRPQVRSGMGLPANVLTIESLQEYKKVVADEESKVVAVRFYATWCKACKAVAPHFYKLAKSFPDTIFVDVPVTNDNAALHQGLGIPSLPYGHIYHPQTGLVEKCKLTRKDVMSFKKSLRSYVEGRCILPEEPSS